jgi:hypothetical protein
VRRERAWHARKANAEADEEHNERKEAQQYLTDLLAYARTAAVFAMRRPAAARQPHAVLNAER